LPRRRSGETRSVVETVAGALLSITGIGLILSIITNEALYPAARHYSTFANEISDLGGTKPPNSFMVQPNRWIFIVSMAVAGALVLIATYLLWRVIQRRRFLVALGLLGIGLVGIAVFPGNIATYHVLFSLLCFVGGSVAAILSRNVLGHTRPVFRRGTRVDCTSGNGVRSRCVLKLGTPGSDRDRRSRAMDRLPGPPVASPAGWRLHDAGDPPYGAQPGVVTR
jgi:hypothetical membrane protein